MAKPGRKGKVDGEWTALQLRVIEVGKANPTLPFIDAAKIAGYSPAGAKGLIRTQPHVFAAYGEMVREHMAGLKIDEGRIMAGLAEIAFGDIRKVLRWDSEEAYLSWSNSLTQAEANMIKSVRFQENEYGRTVSVAFYSRIEALTILAKCHGMMREVKEINVDVRVSGAIAQVQASLSRMLSEN